MVTGVSCSAAYAVAVKYVRQKCITQETTPPNPCQVSGYTCTQGTRPGLARRITCRRGERSLRFMLS
jgi:hypothetical protein